ncbi:NAD-dependent epimerase/dehydratase family protein [candidate division WOR-3 bacterium]|uniref:NAD-dependent epimerase/dehydratase family protein n=1 Tax=candidate division WOR-3 bacterium TaxID=2052148 RepID=A0A938BTW5_UNCW3|nr:NAD-dependent epimerase/dehydratase family protein [candidate division WOR-3 bacterium]
MSALPPLPARDLDHVLDKTAGLWPELRGKRLFVTGGTGFFGRWLLESFTAASDRFDLGASAVVLSRDPSAFAAKMPHVAGHKSVGLTAGDMSSCETEGEQFNYVIHAAVEPLPVTAGDPYELFERNVVGTKHILELAGRCGARSLFISSGAVYGRQPPELTHVPEEYPGAPDTLDPLTTYGQAKRASEFLCAAFGRKHGLEVIIARCFAFVGPHLPLDAHYAIGNFIRDALRGGPIQVAGDGTPRRSYLYAADLAVWLWTILFRGGSGRAYNVGSDADLSIRELADEVRGVVTPLAQVTVARQPETGKPAERYVPDIARARNEIGLDVWISLPDAIARTANWYRG